MRRLALAIAFGLAAFAAAPIASAEPPASHEYLENRPSGFWTSNRPAVGGAYRWRLLGLGTAIALGTGLLMWRMLKKASAARAAGIPSARIERP